MTRYQRELEALGASYAIARNWDVTGLARVLERAAAHPLITVGSGGSFSVATYCAGLHWRATGAVARAVTPLMLASMERSEGQGLLCASASGRNLDIRAAFRHGVALEMRPAVAFTLDAHSPLHRLAEELGFPDAVAGPTPAEPDGFLAVNSVLVAGLVFARAYRALAGEADLLADSYAAFLEEAMGGCKPEDVAEGIAELGGERTLSVMFSPELEAAAVDLESRFVEAALGHLHASDFRNFGHGRHNWMAKRGSQSAVLALAGGDYAALAERTVKMLPEEVPVVRVCFKGDSDVVGLAGLVTALHVARGRGEAMGVDPGRPGIPEFGRKLFRLSPPEPAEMGNVVVERKRRAVERAHGGADIGRLKEACAASRERLESAAIKGVVLDYDGTLCDVRRRFDRLPEEMARGLERVMELGLAVGVVTGRGKSVGAALRQALPRHVWERVWVGYYNGAECAPLADAAAPYGREAGEFTAKVASVLEACDAGWSVEARAAQVTVTPGRRADTLKVAADIAARIDGVGPMRLVTSSHSVDILMPGVSKTRMIEDLERVFAVPGGGVLRMGDRGAAPGNDYELLRHPLGISVDEVSADLDSCWRWSPAGYVGPRATLDCLNGLTATPEGVRWRASVADGDDN